MANIKFLRQCFAIVGITYITPMFVSGFSAEITSQYAPRWQRSSLIPDNNLHTTRLFNKKESGINNIADSETSYNHNIMNNATDTSNFLTSNQFQTKCRHLYYKGVSIFFHWTSIVAWLCAYFTVTKHIKQPCSQQCIASAVSLSMRICRPFRIVTYFILPLLFILSESQSGVILSVLALVFLLALNIILVTILIAALIIGTFVKKLMYTSLLKDEWILLALVSISLITPWINGRILDQPIYWRNVETEPLGQNDLEAIRDLVKSRTGCKMKVLEAYKVHSPSLEMRYENHRKLLHSKGHPIEPDQLFHGTSFHSARKIVSNGFKIGSVGMFGGGVYFAKTPRKSMNYSKPHNNRRVMLLCDVLMGNSRTLTISRSNLDPKKDLSLERYELVNWGPIFYIEPKTRLYDSVTAVPSWIFPFLSVGTPEFVVYKKEQIIPRYVLIVEPP